MLKYLFVLIILLCRGLCSAQQPVFTPPDEEQLAEDKALAAKGDTVAMCNMGLYYLHGLGVKKDNAKAIQWMGKAAAKGYPQAMLQLGLMYEHGEGTPKDLTKALLWLRKGAAKNEAGSLNELGVLYENGIGVKQDPAVAIKYYRKAVAQERTESMINLGLCYMKGSGTAVDTAIAFALLRKAADKGDWLAMHYLGDFSRTNADALTGCAMFAVLWYLEAADHGDTAAVDDIADLCIKQECPTLNMTIIATHLQQYVNDGYSQASFYLAALYLQGKGVQQSIDTGMSLLMENEEIMITKGIVETNALKNLFVLYNTAGISMANKEKLMNWFKQTAERTGNDSLMADIGGVYIDKDTATEDDNINAMQWSLKAAEKGNAPACYNVGYLYANGLGVARDSAKAFEWMMKAALKGDKDAMNVISDDYEKGKGVTANHEKAVEWYQKANQ